MRRIFYERTIFIVVVGSEKFSDGCLVNFYFMLQY